jgi:exodeoxyribonuclease V alpha subunit
VKASRFEPIDRQFARFLAESTGRDDGTLALAAASASAETRRGHVCLDLARAAETGGDEPGMPAAPPLADWVSLLEGWDAVAAVGRGGEAPGEEGAFRPLVLDGANRLYLHRYWRYERELAESLLLRVGERREAPVCAETLDRLFPPVPGAEPDRQRAAAAMAATRSVALVTGGPGTGKTTTVVKILALLARQAGERPLDVALAAPTGKAAARLKESVEAARSKLDVDPALLARIPSEATTLHRLLGARPGSTRFRHDAGNPLPHDVVIVDEASMVDLPMMAKLLGAMSPHARLILLGDRDQLSSVEPGKVFGDLCDGSPSNRLAPAVAVLTKSHRFGGDSGIGELARLVNEGRGEEAFALAASASRPDLSWHDLSAAGAGDSLAAALLAGYAPCLAETGVRERFEAFGRFRVLCAHRSGPFGVDGVNALTERVLAANGLIRPRSPFYPGRPVMVVRNDYRLKLYNGDIGLLMAEAGGPVRAWFPSGDGFRSIPPARLPEHVSAWATTVHKSQGSEFDRVLLLLGDVMTEALTRELLYTGITRARHGVDLRGTRELFLGAALRRIERRSGLKDALSGVVS